MCVLVFGCSCNSVSSHFFAAPQPLFFLYLHWLTHPYQIAKFVASDICSTEPVAKRAEVLSRFVTVAEVLYFTH